MVGAVQPGFKVSEGAVNMKGMRVGRMKLMFVALQSGFGVAPPSIGKNLAPRLHALLQKATDRDSIRTLRQCQAKSSGFFHLVSMLVGVGDDFNSPENQGAMHRLNRAPPFFPSDWAADNDFVGFHAISLRRYVETDSGKIVRGFKSTYKRHGTVNLFAALDVATGQIETSTTELKRREEFFGSRIRLLQMNRQIESCM